MWLVIFPCFVAMGSGHWTTAAADVYTTGVHTGVRFVAPFAELAIDLGQGVQPLGVEAVRTLQGACAGLSEVATDAIGQDLLTRFGNLAVELATGWFGDADNDNQWIWGIVPATFTRSPHKFIMIIVGTSKNALGAARAASTKTISNAVNDMTGLMAGLFCSAVLTHRVQRALADTASAGATASESSQKTIRPRASPPTTPSRLPRGRAFSQGADSRRGEGGRISGKVHVRTPGSVRSRSSPGTPRTPLTPGVPGA